MSISFCSPEQARTHKTWLCCLCSQCMCHLWVLALILHNTWVLGVLFSLFANILLKAFRRCSWVDFCIASAIILFCAFGIDLWGFSIIGGALITLCPTQSFLRNCLIFLNTARKDKWDLWEYPYVIENFLSCVPHAFIVAPTGTILATCCKKCFSFSVDCISM